MLVWLGRAAVGQGETLPGALPAGLPDGTPPHESVLHANPALTLAELVRATARLGPGRFEVEGRIQEASLLDRAARRWLPGPLAIQGLYMNDAVGSGEGYRQWDVMLEIPVWWPGQGAPRRDPGRQGGGGPGPGAGAGAARRQRQQAGAPGPGATRRARADMA